MKLSQEVYEFTKVSIKENVKTTTAITALCLIPALSLNQPMEWSLCQNNYDGKLFKKM